MQRLRYPLLTLKHNIIGVCTPSLLFYIYVAFYLFSSRLPLSPMVCESVFGKRVLFSVHVFLIYLNGIVL